MARCSARFTDFSINTDTGPSDKSAARVASRDRRGRTGCFPEPASALRRDDAASGSAIPCVRARDAWCAIEHKS